MNVNSPATSRPAYYDRNPVPRTDGAGTSHGAASAVLTDRWTRTIAAGKKAYVEYLQVFAYNNSVTALNGHALAQVMIGASIMLDATTLIGAVGSGDGRQSAEIGGAGYLDAGTVIKGRDEVNNNAAGTAVSTRSICKLVEFDA